MALSTESGQLVRYTGGLLQSLRNSLKRPHRFTDHQENRDPPESVSWFFCGYSMGKSG